MELMSLMKSEDIDKEADLIRRFIIDKMPSEEKKGVTTEVDLNNLLRLTHSLGYRVTIRKTDNTNIERSE